MLVSECSDKQLLGVGGMGEWNISRLSLDGSGFMDINECFTFCDMQMIE